MVVILHLRDKKTIVVIVVIIIKSYCKNRIVKSYIRKAYSVRRTVYRNNSYWYLREKCIRESMTQHGRLWVDVRGRGCRPYDVGGGDGRDETLRRSRRHSRNLEVSREMMLEIEIFPDISGFF